MKPEIETQTKGSNQVPSPTATQPEDRAHALSLVKAHADISRRPGNEG